MWPQFFRDSRQQSQHSPLRARIRRMICNLYGVLPSDAADQYDAGVDSFALYHQPRSKLCGVVHSKHIDFQQTLMGIPRHLEEISDFVDACVAQADVQLTEGSLELSKSGLQRAGRRHVCAEVPMNVSSCSTARRQGHPA